jgi:hypothetical protein
MPDGDPDDWQRERSQRVARWVMLFAAFAVLVVAVGGSISILLSR